MMFGSIYEPLLSQMLTTREFMICARQLIPAGQTSRRLGRCHSGRPLESNDSRLLLPPYGCAERCASVLTQPT